MLIYGIAILYLAEELWEADSTILANFYTDNAAPDGLEGRSVKLLCLLLELGE